MGFALLETWCTRKSSLNKTYKKQFALLNDKVGYEHPSCELVLHIISFKAIQWNCIIQHSLHESYQCVDFSAKPDVN